MFLLIFDFFQIIIFPFQLWLAFLVGYLLLLSLASLRSKPHTRKQIANPSKKFVIMIPAHNEERLLPGTLSSLAHLDYPENLIDIHVVADNCTDQTAVMAYIAGVYVHIRTDVQKPGKGPALQWLMNRVWKFGANPDAFVILDADSIVNPLFLKVLAQHLEQGERVIQAYYAVRNSDRSWSGSLRSAALAVLHFLRPQGRSVLGASVGLKGNGMVFANEVLRRHQWTSSITEDIDMHMALILDGEQVHFAPDAIVLGEMPDTLANTRSQNKRWEHGRFEMCQRYVPKLLKGSLNDLKQGYLKHAYVLFDAVLEHIIPPFSVLFGVSILLFLVNLVSTGLTETYITNAEITSSFRILNMNLGISAAIVLGQVIYLFVGLRLVHAPKKTYLALLYTPIYIVWKVWQLFQMFFDRGKKDWVRTTRNEA